MYFRVWYTEESTRASRMDSGRHCRSGEAPTKPAAVGVSSHTVAVFAFLFETFGAGAAWPVVLALVR